VTESAAGGANGADLRPAAGAGELRSDVSALADAGRVVIGTLGGRATPLVVVLATSLALFAALASDLVRDGRMTELDSDSSAWVAGSMPTWAEWLALPFTWLGGTIGVTTVVVLACLWLVRRGARHAGVLLLVVTLGIQLLVVTGKNGYERPRPDAGSPIELPQSFSFPSGHAATGIAVFGLLGVLVGVYGQFARRRTLVIAGFGLGAVIGASRVVLNVHYVSDVLAGACLGLAWLLACVLVFDVMRR
jgi:undecaprenyl-diphosphatase